ncbi:hypothetical protein PGB28_01380 [Primorskyibacter aestuariivivens]|uniref:hypothetical protein n=1 Tax=Primorskyibacter aestuariivivens TaxID=1888912 RepID=UPI0023006066|nr:hypothetical protein [Primorskyibacter aestuariivivens]MDA7427093.1 hypothetical protein [Primorskyibacter aestuariivivens]
MRGRDVAVCLTLLTAPAHADGITLVPYPPLETQLDGHLDFETLPQAAEPGHNLDAGYVGAGVRLGSHFAGQEIGTRTSPGGQRHDALLSAQAHKPLTLLNGPAGQSLSVALHRGFGSMALFPLGPDGFPELAARGEGSAAFLFTQDQSLIGLRIHSGYPDPLGKAARPGAAHVTCLSRDGQPMARIDIPLATGITGIGLAFDTPIVGCTLTNTDPGGIAIDDLRYRLQALTG